MCVPVILSSPLSALLQNYHKQKDQFEYNLHDLFDLLEETLTKQAVLIELTYEADLLPKYLIASAPEVLELYRERQRVGLEQFHRPSQGYFAKMNELMPLLKSDMDVQDTVLTLYDLSRSKLLLTEFIEKLADRKRRARHSAVIDQLREVLKVKLQREVYYPQLVRKVKPKPTKDGKERKVRNFDERLAHQLSLINGAMKRRWNKSISADLRRQVEEEDDMQQRDFAECKYHQKYESAWHRARDSMKALQIMKEVKLQRSKMRIYIEKMLLQRLKILREQRIITPAEAAAVGTQIQQEVFIEDEEDGDQQPADEDEPEMSPKKKKAKKSHAVETEEKAADSPVMDVDEPHAAPPAAGAAPSSASHVFVDTDTAVSREVMHEGVVQQLQREIVGLQTHAKSIHANVNVSEGTGE
jgi:hypothetical protein